MVLNVISTYAEILLPYPYWFLVRFPVQPWRWRQYISPKHRLTSNWLHGVMIEHLKYKQNWSYARVGQNSFTSTCQKGTEGWRNQEYENLAGRRYRFQKYVCKQTWTLFENRVLRRIFGPKRDEATGGWRKLHNEELHNLFSSLL
jgi:hypothetical protein